MAQGEIARHRTAMSRTELSRPLRLAITLGLLTPGMSVMDFGCGLGGDVKRLKEEGYDCSGWDPVHAPDGAQRKASFVNLGYVVNVIENSVERQDVLKEAWGLAERLLVISARMLDEAPVKGSSALYADGLMTKIGTFQKFFEQQELRTWIEQTLGVSSVAAAPGVIVVYRDDVERQVFMAARFRSVRATPRVSINAGSFEKHRALLEKLADFFTRRGRLPGPAELLEAPAILLNG
jgi:DNA phosphorothioation-associated putative methyltransferase